MADGSLKRIEDIAVGDRVIGMTGSTNTVRDVERVPLGQRLLYGFNEGLPFVTAEHPFRTPTGWKSLEPLMTAAENAFLKVQRLHVGDQLYVWAADKSAQSKVSGNLAIDLNETLAFDVEPLSSIKQMRADPETTVYNLLLDGDNTYVADGYLVHNKGGDDGDSGGESGDSGDSGESGDSGNSGSGSDSSGSDSSGESGDSGDSGESGESGNSGSGSESSGSDSSEAGESGDDSSSGDSDDSSESGESGDADESGESGDSGGNSESGESGDNSSSDDSDDSIESGESGDGEVTGGSSQASRALNRPGINDGGSVFAGDVSPAGEDLSRDLEQKLIIRGWRNGS